MARAFDLQHSQQSGCVVRVQSASVAQVVSPIVVGRSGCGLEVAEVPLSPTAGVADGVGHGDGVEAPSEDDTLEPLGPGSTGRAGDGEQQGSATSNQTQRIDTDEAYQRVAAISQRRASRGGW